MTRHQLPLKIILKDYTPPFSWNDVISGRMHFSERARLTREAHMVMRTEIDPNLGPVDVPVDILITAYMPHRMAGIMDNCNIPVKILIDGLKGFVIVDDDWRYVGMVAARRRHDPTNPRVEILITASDDYLA